MSFSELEALAPETGLSWDSGRLLLSGTVKDYPVYIADNPDTMEYLLTVFCKTRSDFDKAVTDGINSLLDNMPKNCVTARKNELRYQQIKFNAAPLYQENRELLSDFVLKMCDLLDSLDFLPEAPEPEKAMFPKPQPKPTRQPKPLNAVSKKFDKYSVRGFVGALIGGAAMSVIAAILLSTDFSSIGGMLSGWTAGGLIALVILFDYSLLAKKIDIFGTLACSLITAASCIASSFFGMIRTMASTVRLSDPNVSFFSTVRNWYAYDVLYPDVSSYFNYYLLQTFMSAIAVSVIFYTFYYKRHQSIMFTGGDEYLEKKETGKKKGT